MNAVKKEKGFTIIEVVLVLAIAGLIFLMVFVALPALQRNQRDDARKREIARALAAVTDYRSNTRGGEPNANLAAFAGYVDGKVAGTAVEMGGSGYKIVFNTNASSADQDTIVIGLGQKCSDEAGKFTKGSGKQIAAMMELESGNAKFCQEG